MSPSYHSRYGRSSGRVDVDERQVVALGHAEDRGVVALVELAADVHLERRRAGDDVVVGDGEAVGADDEAAAEARPVGEADLGIAERALGDDLDDGRLDVAVGVDAGARGAAVVGVGASVVGAAAAVVAGAVVVGRLAAAVVVGSALSSRRSPHAVAASASGRASSSSAPTRPVHDFLHVGRWPVLMARPMRTRWPHTQRASDPWSARGGAA